MQISKAKACVGHEWVNIDWEFISGRDHRVMCVIEKEILGLKQTSVESIE